MNGFPLEQERQVLQRRLADHYFDSRMAEHLIRELNASPARIEEARVALADQQAAIRVLDDEIAELRADVEWQVNEMGLKNKEAREAKVTLMLAGWDDYKFLRAKQRDHLQALDLAKIELDRREKAFDALRKTADVTAAALRRLSVD